MSEERSIQDYLDDILNAVYGEEVRNSIVGAIEKCYEDGSAGAVDMIARGRLDVIEPIATDAQATANDNVLASLQVEKKFTTEGVNDINAAIEPGKYYADTATLASAIANQPSDKTASVTFAVLVLQHVATTNVIQILIDSQWKMWIRRGYVSGSAWTYGGWQRFLRTTDLTDLTNAINTKANSASPTISNPNLTGTPKAPTATAGTNTTQIATTAFVKTAVDTLQSTINTALGTKANSASPTISNPNLTGTPKAPTASTGTNTTQIATTAFVKNSIDAIPDAAYNVWRGLIKGVDMMYLDYTKPHLGKVPTYAGLTIASSSRIIIWSDDNKNLRSSASGYAMVTVQINADVTQAISANSAFLPLPVPVGTPSFAIVVRGQTGIIPAYINGNGAVVPTQDIAAGKRIYITLTYCTSDARNWR